jgi:hypothetical protein
MSIRYVERDNHRYSFTIRILTNREVTLTAVRLDDKVKWEMVIDSKQKFNRDAFLEAFAVDKDASCIKFDEDGKMTFQNDFFETDDPIAPVVPTAVTEVFPILLWVIDELRRVEQAQTRAPAPTPAPTPAPAAPTPAAPIPPPAVLLASYNKRWSVFRTGGCLKTAGTHERVHFTAVDNNGGGVRILENKDDVLKVITPGWYRITMAMCQSSDAHGWIFSATLKDMDNHALMGPRHGNRLVSFSGCIGDSSRIVKLSSGMLLAVEIWSGGLIQDVNPNSQVQFEMMNQ